ncbi:MAG: hypothetical protein B7Z62_08725 [Deltaproteobacteria bacterium 37-65-8]|nr:MAG: hypothetical protein B7Z62_08725 [Deltaproteobacteria bacterium 37-65-8]
MRVCNICEEEKKHNGNMLVCIDCEGKVNKGKMKDYYRGKEMFKKYGITIGDYYDIMKSQGGTCKICKAPSKIKGTRRLAIDHDHNTGKVRGLLCLQCNVMIGMSNDNPDRLINAANYLVNAK